MNEAQFNVVKKYYPGMNYEEFSVRQNRYESWICYVPNLKKNNRKTLDMEFFKALKKHCKPKYPENHEFYPKHWGMRNKPLKEFYDIESIKKTLKDFDVGCFFFDKDENICFIYDTYYPETYINIFMHHNEIPKKYLFERDNIERVEDPYGFTRQIHRHHVTIIRLTTKEYLLPDVCEDIRQVILSYLVYNPVVHKIENVYCKGELRKRTWPTRKVAYKNKEQQVQTLETKETPKGL